MRFINFALTLILAVSFAACTTPEPQHKKYRVGIIQFTNTNDSTRQGFIDGMAGRGYKDGINIEYLYFGNAYSFAEIDGLLDRIIERKPDLIYASTTPVTHKAYLKTTGTGIPVVFGPVNDPVKAGIIKDLRAPGENITGIRLTASDQKRLEWITLLNKNTKKVLAPFNMKDTSSNITLDLISKAAVNMNIEIISHPVSTKEDILDMIDKMPDDIDAIFMPRDGLVMSSIEELADICIKKKMILSTPRYAQIKEGATTGYGFIDYELGKQASRLADLVLKGAKAGQIPVETAEDYLFINTEVAEKIGLEISDVYLRQAYREK